MTETRTQDTGRRSLKNSSRLSGRLPLHRVHDITAVHETCAYPETTRTNRTIPRTTLQPSVQDFNGKIIDRGYGETDEDYMLWTVGGGKTQLKLHVNKDDHTYPVPATFRWASSFSPLYLDSAHLPVVPNAIKSERVAAWTEDVHRRHVARTARARARLAPKPMVIERVVPTGVESDPADKFSRSFSLTTANDRDVVEDPRMVQTSRRPKKEAQSKTRPRPATTGRYFDRGNGLRCSKSTVTVRSRPNTATSYRTCGAPGLNIQKVVLRRKELV